MSIQSRNAGDKPPEKSPDETPVVLDVRDRSAVVLDSWRRCEAAGLSRSGRPRIDMLTASEVRLRQQRAERVNRLAHAELQTLARQIAGSNFLLAFADPDGVILELTADQRFLTSGSGAEIQVGSLWSEAAAGTNGLGTALASKGPAAIDGSDHYFDSLHDIACTAAPVRDGQGQIVGVLDASSYVRSRQTHTLALVQMSAMQIENRLLLEDMGDELVLAIHPRPEFLGTLSAGLLAFDHEGRVRAFNERAAQLLAGLAIRIGTGFEALFPEGFDAACRRLGTGKTLPLTDTLGSTVAARMTAGMRHGLVHPVDTRGLATRHQPSQTLTARRPAPRVEPGVASFTGKSGAAAAASTAGPAGHAESAPPGPELLADDVRVEQALRLARRAARMGVPLLIQGETGTGKELLARHAHASSGRKGAFVAVNCGALPAELIEAELFGYVGGAFTGARREGSQGLIVSADGGTLLLDEIAELPLSLQASLLRFLDDGVVRPVGATQGREVDVQLLAASLNDLRQLTKQGRFRKDLLYRLDVAQVRLPALRERSDFAQAVELTLQRIQPQAFLTDDALECLRAHDWPGNFRELRAVLTRALLHVDSPGAGVVLHPWDITPHLPAATDDADPAEARSSGPGVWRGESARERRDERSASEPAAPSHPPLERGLRLHEAATQTVAQSYHRHRGNVSRVARELGISRTTAYRHLREAGLHGDRMPG